MAAASARKFLRPGMSGGVRIAGALLTFAVAAAGIRAVGVSQFGVSVMALAAGQLVAFPLTAMERLLVRLHGQGRLDEVWRIDRRVTMIVAWLVAVGCVLGATVGRLSGAASGLFVAAAATTAACSALLTVRGAYARCEGNLWWGQVPAEIVRPALTLAALVAAAQVPEHLRGASATLLASAVTLATMVAAPRPKRVRSGAGDTVAPFGPGLWKAAASLIVVSAVAVTLERGFPLAVGARTGAAQVAVFALGQRVVQLANFGQAFAIFYHSPQLAAALARSDSGRTVRLCSSIRVLGLAVALPVSALVALSPSVLDRAFGVQGAIEGLRVPLIIAILAVTLSGPAQNVLILSGLEHRVAGIYVCGALAASTVFALMAGDAFAAQCGTATAGCIWAALLAGSVKRAFGRFV